MRHTNDFLGHSGTVWSPMEVPAVSCLHVECRENLDWINSLSRELHREDALLVLVDVTVDFRRLYSTLRTMKPCFSEELFLPSNHEFWVNGEEISCSLESLTPVCCSISMNR